MNLPEIIAVIAILLIVGGAIAYIVREKKKGKRCIGCPYAGQCASRTNCSCADKDKEDKAD